MQLFLSKESHPADNHPVQTHDGADIFLFHKYLSLIPGLLPSHILQNPDHQTELLLPASLRRYNGPHGEHHTYEVHGFVSVIPLERLSHPVQSPYIYNQTIHQRSHRSKGHGYLSVHGLPYTPNTYPWMHGLW